MIDFETLMEQVEVYRAEVDLSVRSNPPGPMPHFAEFLLSNGFDLSEVGEEMLNGVAEILIGDEDTQEASVERAMFVESFAGYIGQPKY